MTDQDRTAADRLAQLEDQLIAVKGEIFTRPRQLIQARRLTIFAGQWVRLARHAGETPDPDLRRAQNHLASALDLIEKANR